MNSMFGYGKVGTTLEFRPAGYRGTASFIGQVTMRYVEPHRHVFDALEYAGQLRRTIEEDNTNELLDSESPASVRLNPLLSSSLSESAASDDNTVGQATLMGNNVLRFGFGGAYPEVLHEHTLTTDLNEDGDTSDAYEEQRFVLLGDDTDDLGIIDRYENYLNPTVDGASLVDSTWSLSLNGRMVPGAQQITKMFGVNVEGYSSVIEFPAVEAVGGLVVFQLDWISQLDDDYEIFDADGNASIPDPIQDPTEFGLWAQAAGSLDVYGTVHLGKWTKAKRTKAYKV